MRLYEGTEGADRQAAVCMRVSERKKAEGQRCRLQLILPELSVTHFKHIRLLHLKPAWSGALTLCASLSEDRESNYSSLSVKGKCVSHSLTQCFALLQAGNRNQSGFAIRRSICVAPSGTVGK